MSPSSPATLAGAYFPGLHSENETWVRGEFQAVLDQWFGWRKRLFADDPGLASAADRLSSGRLRRREELSQHLTELCTAMTAETPTHTPRYIGHMKAEVSLPALFGWLAAMLHNPNNTSRESSRVGSVIETEAVAMLATMVGYDPTVAQGHFTSGGTVANFEAVWRARYRLDHWLSLGLYVAEATGELLDPFAAGHMGWDRFRALWREHGLTDDRLRDCSAAIGNPASVWRRVSEAAGRAYLGPVMLVPGNKHYSWLKAANLFGLGQEALWSVALDHEGRFDVDDFERLTRRAEAEGRPVLMAVSVAGTTETGEIDPIHRLHERLDRWRADQGVHIWRHVDAAYGGFFCSLLGGADETALSPDSASALRAIGAAESVTIDPHKLGYVPYACGAILTRDAAAYAVSAFDAPYLDRPELGDGKWSSTLEGSRSAAGAAATWLTGRSLGFGPDGLGSVLAETVRTRAAFQAAVAAALPPVRFLEPADANIVCFSIADAGETLSSANRRTEALFDVIHQSPEFSVSKTTLGVAYATLIQRHAATYGGPVDSCGLAVIRCVFMNPYWAASDVRETLFSQFIALVRRTLDEPAREAA